MDSIRIVGGTPLQGRISVSGAKNAALPIMCTALLADGAHVFRNVPDLRDVHTMLKMLRHLGAHAEFHDSVAKVEVKPAATQEAPYELVKQMRASVLVLGPLVARYGKASVSLPGGCAIGARPIGLHLRGLETMGAVIDLEHGYVHVNVPGGRLRGADLTLDFPTVTGTENLMSAAVLARGHTTIANAAREPEVEELARVLNKMGARIEGAGTSTITIQGVEGLQAVDHAIMPDRIEAGTFMVAAAATRGSVLVEGVELNDLEAVTAKLQQAGVIVEREGRGARVVVESELKPVEIVTAPHPGFPTDMQAQFMVLASQAPGTSRIKETIFENRFMHVPELNRMGASIQVQGHDATVVGKSTLQGAKVMATDLRASASLVIAGLIAQGTTEVRRVYHLDRGYQRIEEKLAPLGATIERVPGHA